MNIPFIGSEAVATGRLSKSALRSQYTRLFPDDYIIREADRTPTTLARAGWLWSQRRAVVAGRSAAAVLGPGWVDANTPVDLLHGNRTAPAGVSVRSDRMAADEVADVDGMAVTTAERTALDLACWYPRETALIVIDDLLRATEFDLADVEMLAARYPGRRGIRRARTTLEFVDGGSQSPKESWLRLLLIDAGLPRPQTQIPVLDDTGRAIAYVDMGWADIKVAIEYDGEQHRTDRRQYTWDVRRLELLEHLGWIVVRVVAGDRSADVVRRVRAAIARGASLQSSIRRRA